MKTDSLSHAALPARGAGRSRWFDLLLFFLLVSCTVKSATIPAAVMASNSVVSDSTTPLPDTLTIALTGDIMMGTTFPSVMLPANEGRDLFRDVKPLLQSANLAVGNLEGTLLDGGKSAKGEGPNTYAFRTPTSYAPLLTDAGYDFLSQANNHARDFGEEGIRSTEQQLDAQGIKYSGIDGRADKAIVERDGVRYGLCAFGHNSYTYKTQDTATVARILQELRPQCDILVVSFHGGAEGRSHSHLPNGTETFLGENRGSLRQFAHFCVEHGADVIYGHGPHVTRAVEVYKGHFIAYSLGNFCTPYGMSLTGISAYAPVVTVRINRQDGRFIDGHIHSFIQQKGIGPRKDDTNAVAREMKQLTEADFTNPHVSISAEGLMKMKNER